MGVGVVSEREVRIAQNESLFRAVNERIRVAAGGSGAEPMMFVCECGDPDCAESMKLDARDYEAIRAHGDRFGVLPEHTSPYVETVVEKKPNFWVVEKFGVAEDVAEDLDPRS